MSVDELASLFEKHSDEFLQFDQIPADKRKHKCEDLHAFELLNQLVPQDGDIICHAEHDEIWLAASLEELAKVITEEQVIELIRCGVRCDSDTETLCMFV